MFCVDSEGNVLIGRGNIGYLGLIPTDRDTGEPLEINSDDIVIFKVVNTTNKDVITKVLGINDYDDETKAFVVNITPEDTVHRFPATLKYDALYLEHGTNPYTFISRKKFVISETYATYLDLQSEVTTDG